MRRLSVLLLSALLLLTGCQFSDTGTGKQYSATFLTLFDTVTTIVGKAESEEAFRETAQNIHDELLIYHELFDIYNDYDGISNLKTINDNAGLSPVTVDRRIIDLLLDCRHYFDTTNGRTNIAMGSVLKLWHEARSDGMDDPAAAVLPDRAALEDAAAHTSWDSIVIDEEASTVYIADSLLRLDVGAVAKGWAVARVAETAPAGLLISVGGNVCATGAKDDAGTPWVIGIQDPADADSYLHTIRVTEGSVVTSGDYQRYYVVDGVPYHHIIDPDTLYPAALWRSVTIVCADSGAADALSTALFLLDREAGARLLAEYDAEAMWVACDGTIYYTPGFEELIRT